MGKPGTRPLLVLFAEGNLLRNRAPSRSSTMYEGAPRDCHMTDGSLYKKVECVVVSACANGLQCQTVASTFIREYTVEPQ